MKQRTEPRYFVVFHYETGCIRSDTAFSSAQEAMDHAVYVMDHSDFEAFELIKRVSDDE